MLELGYRRVHVPLYDSTGAAVNVEHQAIYPGDVLAVELNLNAQLYSLGANAGFGLRKNLRSVTKIRSRRVWRWGWLQKSPLGANMGSFLPPQRSSPQQVQLCRIADGQPV